MLNDCLADVRKVLALIDLLFRLGERVPLPPRAKPKGQAVFAAVIPQGGGLDSVAS